MKRILLLVMVAVLLVPAGLSLAQEKPTISYYAYWTGALDPGSYVETFVEDKLNMNIDVRKVTHTDKEAVNLMLASGNMPDCGWFEQTAAYMAREELTRPIPVEMVKKYVPGLIEIFDQYPILYGYALDPNDETQFLFLPDIYVGSEILFNPALYLRYDWIEKLGIDLGVNVEKLNDQLYIADNGLTLEVFENILNRFVKDDPDGNGQNDTFGLLKDWPVTMLPSQNLIASFIEHEGKGISWFAHPDMKKVLMDAQRMYASGALYSEIFTVRWGEDWELINTGKAGVLSGNAVATVWLNPWANNRPPLSLMAGNPEAKLLMIPGLVGPNGMVNQAKWTKPTRWERFFVNWDVSDEKLADILTFFNFTNFSDEETMATLWMGEKGVDWEWQGDKPVKLKTLQNGERGTQIFCRNVQAGKVFEWDTYGELFSLGMKYYILPEGGVWNKGLVYPYKEDLLSQSKAAEVQNEYGQDWTATYETYFMNVILGKANVEEDWDAYIKKLYDLKYGDFLAEMEKVPPFAELVERYK